MKRLIMVFALSVPGFITLAQVGPESVNRTGRGRYTAAQNFEVKTSRAVFTQPPYNGDSRMLDGYGKAAARELGLAGREVWNEYPQEGAVKVTLAPNAELYYDTASREPLYLGGCLRKGKSWVNRVKLVTPPRALVRPEQPLPVVGEVVREPAVNIINEHPITNNHPITVQPSEVKVTVVRKDDLNWFERYVLRDGYWASGIYYHVRMPQEVSLLRKEIRGFRALDRVRIPGPQGEKGDKGNPGDPCDPEKNPLCRGPQGPPGQCFILVDGQLKPCFTPPPNTSRP